MRLKLEIRTSNGRTVTVPIREGELRIGRSKENDLQLREPGVSKQHALLIRKADGTLSLRDLGSSNGTTVNGHRVHQCNLGVGDRFCIGRASLRIRPASGVFSSPDRPEKKEERDEQPAGIDVDIEEALFRLMTAAERIRSGRSDPPSREEIHTLCRESRRLYTLFRTLQERPARVPTSRFDRTLIRKRAAS